VLVSTQQKDNNQLTVISDCFAPMPKAVVAIKGLGMSAETAELEKLRKERPAHFVASLKSCNDALLCQYMRNFSIEPPHRRGRVSKAERIDSILKWNTEEEGRSQSVKSSKSKSKYRKSESESESESSESDNDSSDDSDSTSSIADSDPESDSSSSESSGSDVSEPPTPPPVKKSKKHTKKVPIKMPKQKTAHAVKAPKKTEVKVKEKKRPSRPQRVEIVLKTEKFKPKARKVKEEKESETDEDQDNKKGTESKFVESSDQPDTQSEINILLGECRTGNNSRLVRAKLKDAKVKQQLSEHISKQTKSGALSVNEAQSLRDDFDLN